MIKNLLVKTGLLFTVLLIPAVLYSQDWVSQMKDNSVNFFEVQKTFNKYYKKASRELEREKAKPSYKKRDADAEPEEESEVPGYTQYKRWEWFMAPRVSATGERFNPSQVWTEMTAYKQQNPNITAAGNWTFMGPSTTSALAGAGRLNFVRVDPNNANSIYVGSPAGGLWHSIDGGNTWTSNTDNIAQVIGCTDIAIDPANSNIMYLATGDGDGGDTYTVGVLKTIDGGLTWNTTGLTFYPGNVRQMSRILIDPSNSNNITVATSGGIYHSNDAAVTFTLAQAGSFKDMELKPGTPSIMYAAGTEFFRSSNGGLTWTKITSGLPAAATLSRIAIAVSPADPNYVYLLIGLAAPNYGTEGFYKSTNGGTSFSKTGTPANIGTQQWYDLAIAASPTNVNEVIIAGQYQTGNAGGVMRSTNAGSSFSLIATGNTINSTTSGVHTDYHDVVYASGTQIYITSDGGIYGSSNNGTSWTNLNNNLAISQMYGFGQSTTNANLTIQGWQDNGTNIYDGTWQQTMGGDGMLAFISKSNDNNMWGSQYNGSLNRSTNGGNTWSGITGISETGAWVTPWIEDPVTSNTLWAGFVNVWKSTNGGATWTKKSTFTNTAALNAIAVSPANNLIIWTAKAGGFYKSADGGTTWTTITNAPAGNISYITCSNTDPNKAWITYSGFANTTKVFQTNDQGLTWINLSGSVPNIPVNCITYVNNSNDALYIGTDVGVYYKDASLSSWQPFTCGLPNVIVTQINIFYPTGKIRASTYGRGMWESDPYLPGTYAPTVALGADKKIACPGAAIHFTDFSAGQPTSWNWTFTGGNPATSTLQNPVVYYNTTGTFPVTLTATNANGFDTKTFTDFIIISSSPYNNPTTTGAVVCGPTTTSLSASGSGVGTLRWWDAPGGGNVLAIGNTYSPAVNGTATYYVDEDFPSGNLDYTGETTNGIGAGAFFTANDIRGLYFDINQPVVLNTVDVYANTAGNRTIEILDAQGNTFADTTVFIPASGTNTTTVTVNFTLYPGTNYFIKCRGLVDLYRNTAGANYPYTGTYCTITNSNAGSPGYYYFFYNWVLTEITCNTGRTACTVTDTCSTAGINELMTDNQLDVFPNPSNGVFSVDFNAAATDDYKVSITNAVGQTIYNEQLQSFKGNYKRTIDVKPYGSGVYMLSITNSKNEIFRRVVVY